MWNVLDRKIVFIAKIGYSWIYFSLLVSLNTSHINCIGGVFLISAFEMNAGNSYHFFFLWHFAKSSMDFLYRYTMGGKDYRSRIEKSSVLPI